LVRLGRGGGVRGVSRQPARVSVVLASRSATEFIAHRIYFIRGRKVMLDSDLAGLYQVETKALNRAVKRNPNGSRWIS